MAQLPPFKTLLKSTEVEDPINIMVHRPIAYAFVWSLFKTSITPNMVTFMSMFTGIIAGTMFLWGVPQAMIAGGALLWASSILDGADGLLARARNAQSQFGRALDGWADAVVALCTVFPAFYHVWNSSHNSLYLWLMVPSIGLTLIHQVVYDFYKENYLRATRPDQNGESEEIAHVESLVPEAKARGFWTYFAVKHALLPRLRQQKLYARTFDPTALASRSIYHKHPQIAEIYRSYNQGPMRLWAIISLAPHSYLMAICAMADKLEVYLYIRLFVMNAIFVTAMIWQRRASKKTIQDLSNLPSEEKVPTTRPAAAA